MRDDPLDYPRLRPVEAIPAGEGLICLRDPQGFSDKIVFLPPPLFFVVTLFDGEHSILDIQTAYTRRFGELLFSEKVREIITQLDEALFLEGERFETARRLAVERFRSAPVRPATHAGTAYERDEASLLSRFDALFAGESEWASPPGREDTASSEQKGEMEGGTTLSAIIAPHIDISRGGPCFAASYAELAARTEATTFLILGISHAPTSRRFVLTDKAFDTPLGRVEPDGDFIDGIRRACSTDFFEDEHTHLNEHSIEFQVLFLRYLFRENREIRIVPVLCSTRPGDLNATPPAEDPEFREFVHAAADLRARRGSTLCIIAGVDLAHLGKRFGQNISLTPRLLKWAEGEDRRMIDLVLSRDASGFLSFIRQEKDGRNVCGVPALYVLLTLLGSGGSRLLRYDQAADREADSVVTFMGAAFYDS